MKTHLTKINGRRKERKSTQETREVERETEERCRQRSSSARPYDAVLVFDQGRFRRRWCLRTRCVDVVVLLCVWVRDYNIYIMLCAEEDSCIEILEPLDRASGP